MPSFEKAKSFFPKSFSEAPLFCFAYVLFQTFKPLIDGITA